MRLAELLDGADCNVLLIDTPAGVTPFGRAAIAASSAIVTPMIPGYLEFRALERLMGELENAELELRHSLQMLGVLFINTHERSIALREYREHLTGQGTPVFGSFVRRAQRVADHARFGQPTLVVEPDGPLAADVRAVAAEIVSHCTYAT